MNLAFVTAELAPSHPGGAGTVVAGLAELLTAAGHTVTIGVAAPGPAAAPPGVRLEQVVPAADTPGARSAASATLARGFAAADLIEFPDYDALGYETLIRRAELGLGATTIAVRFHGPADLMIEAMGVTPRGLELVAVEERECFAMADVVLVPSPAMGGLAIERYGLDPERVLVAPPPVPDVVPAPETPRAGTPLFAVLGRLSEVKGSHDLVDAALLLLDDGLDLRVVFLGEDGWSATADRPMIDWLGERIPGRHRDRFEFAGRVPRADLPARLAPAWAVVVPSRFESFSLAAHEARAIGLPVVVPDLAAFRDHWSAATGAEVYDGTVSGLAVTLRRLVAEPGRLDALRAAPAPERGDPAAPYRRELPPPRHPRSQAGLAGAAVQRVEAATPTAGTSRLARAARRGMRGLPEPAARLAVRILPQRVKDRFRMMASWPEEQARRERERRRASFREAVAAGRFPELDEPEVTVVVPCYDQGAYLEDALASVFAQTFPSFEVVVVDDGSTDPATVAVLERLDLPRTRVIRQANRGLPGARNSGMATARGRFLVPLDADDELHPEFLARLHPPLVADAGAGYAHCWAELFGDVTALWATRPWNPYTLAISNSVVGCVLLRRSAWEDAGGYDETMLGGNEDWELWVRLMRAGWGQVRVREPLFRYRKHGVSMSVETESRFEQGARRVVERHRDLYAGLRDLKREWYPFVTVLVAGDRGLPGVVADQDLDDVEILPVGGAGDGLAVVCGARGWRLADPADDEITALHRARGKFLADWRTVTAAGTSTLRDMATGLEADPGGAAAGIGPAALWRRWALLDPFSRHERVVSLDPGLEASGQPWLHAGLAPDPAWMAPAGGHLPVQRQHPEVEGTIPRWVEEAVG